MVRFVSVQSEDFDLAKEYESLRAQSGFTSGAIVTFSGLVRDFDDGQGRGLFLQHYPAMTEKVLHQLLDQAEEKWPIISSRLIHRVGEMSLGEHIVFVGVSSAHRDTAFDACRFLMDFLKTDAPFWKKALSEQDYWVEAKDSDQNARQHWLSKSGSEQN